MIGPHVSATNCVLLFHTEKKVELLHVKDCSDCSTPP
uniref:Uncharacterized protein n=1 Tax=Arundo donax TaxID=35708 RepID=A0A0A8ZLS4_ARUDO